MTVISEVIASHIISVYNAMEEEAEELDDLKIYTGSLSKLVPALGISMTFYSPIFRVLYDAGYCALGDRGGRDKPSTVILIRSPKKDELMALTSVTDRPIVSVLTRLESLESSLGGMSIVGALKEIEDRLVALEAKERKSNARAKKQT